jgi:hypothetical protein
LTYRLITTEFWRITHRITARTPASALQKFRTLRGRGKLPEPERRLLGSIDDPEEIIDPQDNTVLTNHPPADDAERMLWVEVWRRLAPDASRQALEASIAFVCRGKGWDAPEIAGEVFARKAAALPKLSLVGFRCADRC